MMFGKKVSEILRKLTGLGAAEEKTERKEKVPLGMKRCPQCANLTMRSAVRCIHCGHFFGPTAQ